MSMTRNTLFALLEFFGVSRKEFEEFWVSLSEKEREYYRTAKLN